jgi:hypothetical protein
VLIRSDVGILNDVFSFEVITDNGTRDSKESLVIAPHQNFKERRLAFEYPPHDFFVA